MVHDVEHPPGNQALAAGPSAPAVDGAGHTEKAALSQGDRSRGSWGVAEPDNSQPLRWQVVGVIVAAVTYLAVDAMHKYTTAADASPLLAVVIGPLVGMDAAAFGIKLSADAGVTTASATQEVVRRVDSSGRGCSRSPEWALKSRAGPVDAAACRLRLHPRLIRRRMAALSPCCRSCARAACSSDWPSLSLDWCSSSRTF